MGSSFTRVRYMQQGKSINYGEKDAICAMLRVKNTFLVTHARTTQAEQIKNYMTS
jgi:hypothetical protein